MAQGVSESLAVGPMKADLGLYLGETPEWDLSRFTVPLIHITA